jgi:hypothetical protein
MSSSSSSSPFQKVASYLFISRAFFQPLVDDKINHHNGSSRGERWFSLPLEPPFVPDVSYGSYRVGFGDHLTDIAIPPKLTSIALASKNTSFAFINRDEARSTEIYLQTPPKQVQLW